MPAASRSPSRRSRVAAAGSSDNGRAAAATVTPINLRSETSGSTNHESAGGSNGFATSQLASSLKMSGTPLATARRQASSSNETSSRARALAVSAADAT